MGNDGLQVQRACDCTNPSGVPYHDSDCAMRETPHGPCRVNMTDPQRIVWTCRCGVEFTSVSAAIEHEKAESK